MSDDLAFGRTFRAVRVRHRLRQRDLAERSGVSIAEISAVENGRLGEVRVGRLRAASNALRLRLGLTFIPARGDLADLVDVGHAALVERSIVLLRQRGWETVSEAEFSGGSIDVLAWHVRSSTLLVVEVKPRLTDLQAALRQLGRYERLAPIVARRFAWQPRVTGRLMVVGTSAANRRVLQAHRSLLQAALPGRNTEARAWLRRPIGRLDAIVGLSLPPALRPSVDVRVRLGREGRAIGRVRGRPGEAATATVGAGGRR